MSTALIAVLAALAVGLGVYVAFLLSGKKVFGKSVNIKK